jgi:hypothetical protein
MGRTDAKTSAGAGRAAKEVAKKMIRPVKIYNLL